jgi:hypothetical protein
VRDGVPDLTVDPSCVNWIEEAESYRYPDGARSNSDNPIKEHDHCLIAGTLIETDRGLRRIEDVQNGDLVWTRDGLRPVISAGVTNPEATVYRLTTTLGREIIGTGKHPVWTRRGWVTLDALRYGDIIAVWESAWTPSHSTASHSGGIRMPRPMRNAPILSRMQDIASAAWDGFTRKSGSSITDRFLPGVTFTTGMATASTTIRPTLNVSPLRSTRNVTPLILRASASVPTSRVSVTSPQSGTNQTRGALGTANTASERGNIASLLSDRATSAAPRSPASLSGTTIDSAPTPASPSGGDPRGLMTRIGRALTAAQRSVRTSTARPAVAHDVVRGRFVLSDRRPVYNLTVSGTPEYFANGVLVHICMDATRYGVWELSEPVPEFTDLPAATLDWLEETYG